MELVKVRFRGVFCYYYPSLNVTCAVPTVIENEAPPPTLVLIPKTGIENSVNFTARALTLETVCYF